MPQRSANNERPLAPTAPSRRQRGTGDPVSVNPADSPAELNPSSAFSKVLRQRELANASRTPSGATRPSGPRAKKPSSAVVSTKLGNARRVRPVATQVVLDRSSSAVLSASSMRSGGLHPLSNGQANGSLRAYEEQTLGSFDRIVPVLKRLSALQHENNFVEQAQRLALAELGHELPQPILETAWTAQLDMRTLFACLLYTSPSPRDQRGSRMPSSA